MQVIAEQPCTLIDINVLKSACIPAPPPESLPAIERTTSVYIDLSELKFLIFYILLKIRKSIKKI